MAVHSWRSLLFARAGALEPKPEPLKATPFLRRRRPDKRLGVLPQKTAELRPLGFVKWPNEPVPPRDDDRNEGATSANVAELLSAFGPTMGLM